MLAMQRTVLLDDMARDIGYEGEKAEPFISRVNLITEATTLPSPSFFQRPPREHPPQDGPATVIIS